MFLPLLTVWQEIRAHRKRFFATWFHQARHEKIVSPKDDIRDTNVNCRSLVQGGGGAQKAFDYWVKFEVVSTSVSKLSYRKMVLDQKNVLILAEKFGVTAKNLRNVSTIS